MIRCSEPTNDFLAALENMPERGEGRLHNYTMGLCNKGINAGLTADQLYDILEPLRPWRPNELESTIQKAEEEAHEWSSEDSQDVHANRTKRARPCDPHAAAKVFNSGLFIRMFGIDVTYKAYLNDGDIDATSVTSAADAGRAFTDVFDRDDTAVDRERGYPCGIGGCSVAGADAGVAAVGVQDVQRAGLLFLSPDPQSPV